MIISLEEAALTGLEILIREGSSIIKAAQSHNPSIRSDYSMETLEFMEVAGTLLVQYLKVHLVLLLGFSSVPHLQIVMGEH